MRKELAGNFSTRFSVTEKWAKKSFQRSRRLHEDFNCPFEHLKEKLVVRIKAAFPRKIFKTKESVDLMNFKFSTGFVLNTIVGCFCQFVYDKGKFDGNESFLQSLLKLSHLWGTVISFYNLDSFICFAPFSFQKKSENIQLIYAKRWL